MNKFLVLIFITCFSGFAHPDNLIIDYKDFYNHLSKLEGESLNLLQFSFGLQNPETGSRCNINKAYISTPKKRIELSLQQNSFTMQDDKALKIAEAKVILELADGETSCDMLVQLETKQKLLKDASKQEELHAIYRQYSAFFENAGGFLSFTMPTVEGLVFQFESGLFKRLLYDLEIKNGTLNIPAAKIKQIYRLDLPSSPLRITPLLMHDHLN